MSIQQGEARRIQDEHAATAHRRREGVKLLGAGVHNDFELLAVMAVLSGWITRSRAAHMIGVTLAEYRRDIEPLFLELLRAESPDLVARALEEA